MKNVESDLTTMEELETELEGLFKSTAPEIDGAMVGRIAARAAAGKRRKPWAMRLAVIGVSCAAVLAGIVVLGGEEPASEPASSENNVPPVVAEAETEAGMNPNVGQVLLQEQVETKNQRRLPAELTELGEGVDEHEVSLAMGTYLNMDFESEGLGFDDWDGDSQGLTEEELLQVTEDLLRNGG